MSLPSTQGIDAKILPNLPGFKAKPPPTGAKKHFFQICDGQVFLRDECIPQSNSYDNIEDGTSINSLTQTTVVSKARKQLALQNSGIILNFIAFFQETIEGSNRAQVRQANVFFFVEDGSIKVVEKPILNSGVSQGTLVKRAVIPKPDGNPIIEEDLQVGEDLVIYGRRFRLVDADPATRNYYREHFGIHLNDGQPIPTDSYSQYRKTVEPGKADTWGKFHAKKNENKTFNEARLGHSVDNKGREGFLKYGNQTLKFRCLWDDTQHLYGDVNEFSLTYFLADDSLEIISIPSTITKEQNRLKLLKKSRLPKTFHSTMGLGSRPTDDAFFHWSDFYIGLELEVYGRLLQIVDADNSTREFYNNNEMSLGPPIVRPPPEVTVHQREVPPPTGFGSEEDSLRSVAGSLLPGPPPVKKLGENKVLSFFCSLLSGGIDDVDRRFVITYYVQDSTLKIVEPPVRNSGFAGGVFLSRRSVKQPNGETIKEVDLFVGCRLKVLKHEFLLLDTNETTLHWMEDKGFPRSNFYMILDKIRPSVYNAAVNGELNRECQKYETRDTGVDQISKDDFRKVLSKYDLCSPIFTGEPDYISEHELRTILRANGNKKPTFNYRKIVEQIVRPTDEYK